MRRIKKKLKSWAKSIPPPNYTKIQAATALESHQANMEDKIVTHDDIQMEINLQLNLHTACRQEAKWWRLKSRCKWFKEGDRNSDYFHKLTEARKCHNRVLEI